MLDTNYVAAWMDYKKKKVVIIERNIHTGERVERLVNPPYYFYLPDEEGEFESIFGDKLIRANFDSQEEYAAALHMFPVKFESDIKPVARVLMDEYYDRPTPPVNFAFLDIEVNYQQINGFAGPVNPYAPINAVTIYQSWTKRFLTYAVCPPGVDVSTVVMPTEQEMREEFDFNVKPEIMLCRDEAHLLEKLLDAIQESDIISGWNSEFYDIPYICERMKMVMGEQSLRALELPGAQPPRIEMRNRFGNEEPIYTFSGRSHLDYLNLFQKFTFEGRTSYALANIAYEELDVPKLDFDGTLEELYNGTYRPSISSKDPTRYGKTGLVNQLHTKQIDREIIRAELSEESREFQEIDIECKHLSFKLFVAYNIRDTELLKLLDEKFKFIQLSNVMAHENTVPFQAVLGTVKYVETGIANHAHNVLKKIVHDKTVSQHDKVEGAIVLSPKIGLHDWIGSVDINSLYPNVIRSINISPEKIIGQFGNSEDEIDWLAIFENSEDVQCTCIFESGLQETRSAAEWKSILIKNKWALSAYGTIFDQSNGRGVVADILGFWYTERKRLQAEKKKYSKLLKEETSAENRRHYEKEEAHYDLLQLTKKIAMNSLYGALLNPHFRFGREELGASVTATGRRITKFMIETMGYLLTGTQDEVTKKRVWENGPDGPKLSILYDTANEAVIYSDTDSVDGNSIVKTTLGEMPISELFDCADIKWKSGENEMAASTQKILTPCFVDGVILQRPVTAIYRHKVRKPRFKITLTNGKSVIVTGDHSMMVLRHGELIEIQAMHINRDTDLCISIGKE